jgi:hypothetical protein
VVVKMALFLQSTVVALFAASSLAAQTPRPQNARGDSSRASTSNRWPQAAWISGGLGVGTWPSGSLAGVASGWYTSGELALGVRIGGASQIFGEQRSDQALLVGARTPGTRGFLLAAAGVGRIASSRSCDGPCSGGFTRPSATALAYSFEGHGNLDLAGIGLVMFGALGPTSVRYNAFAITVNLGWFGP